MKKTPLILLLLCTMLPFAYGSPADSSGEVVRLQEEKKLLDDSVRKLNDSITTLRIANAEQQFVDSSAVAKAKADPEHTIYKFVKDYAKFRIDADRTIAILLIIIIGVFVIFAYAKVGFLRDKGYDASGKLLPISERPFSYSRTQLCWWTLVVLACFICFFVITGCLLPLNAGCVALLGLGAVVHISGRIIDSRDVDENMLGHRKQDGATDKHELHSKKRNFLKDILSDGGGMSIHRFQSVVFNLVFGIGFVVYFAKEFAAKQYPLMDLSTWQLALLGISSATYLGIKTSENSAKKNNVTHNDNNVQPTPVNSKKEAPQAEEAEEPTYRNPSDFEQ